MTERHIVRLTVVMTQLFQISPDSAQVAIAAYRAESGLSYQRIYTLLTTGKLRYRGGKLHHRRSMQLRISVNIEPLAAALRAATKVFENLGPELLAASEAFRERWASLPPLPRCRCIIDPPAAPPPSPPAVSRFAGCPGCKYFDPNPFMPCAVNPSGPPAQLCPDRV
ncbi:hypothetical protein [Pseudanabaena sp. FACHB-2040]|uniref:hypothetical protein n=1 Tax=Pseudanabaena sp. FACHB-2040 TaxID=2692859 RepID=UPI001684DA08|nr:hypothetical protein [Pseudanabaena sp. FACHB-2040]MBD2261378.1 hypothetical protein [Pseudanabaena sp. FACHB-2040]